MHKHLHDWLPLNDFLFKQKQTHDRECPSCKNETEDHWHFLECQAPNRVESYQNLRSNLQAYAEKTKTSNELINLLWDGIKSIWKQKDLKPADEYPVALQALYHSQKGIGWEQLMYGRFSYHWGEVFEQQTEEKLAEIPLGGSQWISEPCGPKKRN